VLRRLKKEVESQLPDKVEHILRCDLSAWQKCLYSHVREHGIIATEGGGGGEKGGQQKSKNLQNTLMQLRKVCNHPYVCCP
jgi:SNF2 family DNA or RNA helicase